MARYLRGAAALALAVALSFSAADAQVVTTPVALSQTAWTDLGAGPLLLSASGGEISYVIANAGTTPALATAGYGLLPNDPPVVVQTGQHVYALQLQTGSGNAIVSPVTYPSVTTTPKAGAWLASGCTVGTSSASCLSSGTYNHVFIQNVSVSANIACTWSGSSAALNSSSSVTLYPGMSMNWGPETAGVPSASGLACIATAASSPLYMESN